MGEFVKALVSESKNVCIPEEDDWFAPLIGDWGFDYFEPYDRHLKGEWYFRRVLDGMAIEDVFICPSRDTKVAEPQTDGEYGLAIRMYQQDKHFYDMTYVCGDYTTRLEIHKKWDKIVCTMLDEPRSKWIFSEITENTFHWQNLVLFEDGRWKVNCEIYAERR